MEGGNKRYIEGEVKNTISSYYLVTTNSPKHPHVSLVRNPFTIEKDPLREHLSASAKLLLEVLNEGTPDLDFRIVELTRASAREQFEKCYAGLLKKGQVSMPEGLSDVTPPTIKLSEYPYVQANGHHKTASVVGPVSPEVKEAPAPSSKLNGSHSLTTPSVHL